MKKMFIFLAISIFVLFTSISYASMGNTYVYSSISGRVTDSLTGDPIAGAKVRVQIKEGDEKAVVFSNSNGEYIVDSLQPGTYRAMVFATDYNPLKYGVPIDVDACIISGVNFKMVRKHKTDVEDTNTISLPKEISLGQNYPNPFNPTTTIRFEISDRQQISLKVYNVLGQVVKTLVNETKAPGVYYQIWDGKDDNGQKVSSGVYFYKLNVGNVSKTKKMMMLK